jgi:outer membrane lipoprotein-sorting protein
MKKNIVFVLIFRSFLAVSQIPVGFQKVKNQLEIADKIKAVSDEISTQESDFRQLKHLDILENDIESKGRFSYKKTNLLRWEYSTPYVYKIVMNGKNMWIDDGKKVQKYDTKSNKMFGEINDLMVGLLQGNILRSKSFTVQFYENKQYTLAELIPLTASMKEFLAEIQIYFDNKNFDVSKVKMLENSGDYTLIEFFNKKNNQPIQDSYFNLK